MLLLADSSTLGAALFTVTRTDDQLDTSPGDGFCIAQNGGGCSLRAAVQEANSLFGADFIYLPAGTYNLTRAGAGEDLAATGDLDVTSAITLLGTGWAVTTIAMDSFHDRLFDVQGFSSLTLGDVTLLGGSVAGVGGGIYVRTGGTLNLARSRVQGCFAYHGGAIGTLGGSVTVEDSELAFNYAVSNPPTWYGQGPAVASDAQGIVVIRRSSVHDNRHEGTLRGVEVWNSSLSVEASSIIDDGLFAYSLYAEQSDVSIISSSLNAISFVGASPPSSTLTIGCSILAYCSTTGGNVSYSNYGLNVFFAGGGCLGPGDVDGEWNLFPLWAPPGKFPARVPNSYSSALDGGHLFVCAADDMWSQALRPYDNDGDGIAVVDIGAVEANLIFFDGFNDGGTWNWSSTQN